MGVVRILLKYQAAACFEFVLTNVMFLASNKKLNGSRPEIFARKDFCHTQGVVRKHAAAATKHFHGVIRFFNTPFLHDALKIWSLWRRDTLSKCRKKISRLIGIILRTPMRKLGGFKKPRSLQGFNFIVTAIGKGKSIVRLLEIANGNLGLSLVFPQHMQMMEWSHNKRGSSDKSMGSWWHRKLSHRVKKRDFKDSQVAKTVRRFGY